jgi:Tfp pilus assembly PilM family ATPase
MFGNHRKGWIGIEWGTQTLRLAQVERGRGECRVVAMAAVTRYGNPIDPRDLLSGVPAWSAEELLAAIHSDANFSGRKVACALPMHLTELRELTVPPGTADEQYAMVSNDIFTAQDETEGNVVFDFWKSEDSMQPQGPDLVNAMSAPVGVVDELTRTLTQAGFDCELLDGLPFSLSRAVSLMSNRPDSLLAVLDWGRISSTFCLVSRGTPLFTRHLRNCGLAKLLDDVGRSLGIPEEEVCEVLSTHGLPGESRDEGRIGEIQAVIAEITQPQLEEMAEELKRTIAYLGTRHAEAMPERLFLTGDGAAVRHVDRFLSAQIEMPVEIWGLASASSEERVGQSIPLPHLATAVSLSALAWLSDSTNLPT